ncbi:outer membrane protein assembly factor BamE [Pseudothauera nasutitermitis]|uniref:Outer membrane protein assembly factor BamE n=1 Tax=Pseudothauera nasutitermitis TaxID=2565930 RepID=A0A4S4AMI1_9RHOO|nr:outer membrane protein assembly factor BamE [Pseudothauera nasutitermitis]THF60789.1 outer membrane protein assembly factor BamE [Pseudothauera nasutitermitis]
MSRLLSLWCALLTALGLPACDAYNLRALQPGVSTAAEVRERLGPPQVEWPNADGSVTWEYSRQPEGVECYMITLGTDGILRGVEQVLNEAGFARVQPGMSGDEVLRLLGRPATRQFFELKGEAMWSWLIERSTVVTDRTYFTVSFDRAGQVTGTGRNVIPKN